VVLVDLKPFTVAIGRGDGLIARYGDIVMFIADPSASADSLIAAVKAEADSSAPGRQLARRLAALAFGQTVSLAPFGVVAATADGLHVLLYGNVTAEIETPEGIHELSGARALTWVDEIVPGFAQRIAVTGAGKPALSGGENTDLDAGVVPGGGFDLYRAGAAKGQQPRREPVTPEQPEPPPSAAPEGPAPVADIETEAFTRAKETAMAAASAGSLASEDGATYRLDRPYVIGRDPLGDESVLKHRASPIVVKNDPHVSRVHAYVSVKDGRVFVRDGGTPAGTFIAAPGAEEWTQIGTAPTELAPGWSLRVGELILTYRTESRP
jgi:FHA domain-containing protein